jgi:hypothetical protein
MWYSLDAPFPVQRSPGSKFCPFLLEVLISESMFAISYTFHSSMSTLEGIIDLRRDVLQLLIVFWGTSKYWESKLFLLSILYKGASSFININYILDECIYIICLRSYFSHDFTVIITIIIIWIMGHLVAYLVEILNVIRRKVVGSNPDQIVQFFILPNPSSRTRYSGLLNL